MTRLLGIDPGLNGAVALLDADGILEVTDLPTLETDRGGKSKRQLDVRALAAMLRDLKATSAVMERVGPMPKQGASSTFSFGRTFGQLEGVIAALGIPTTLVAPVKWKRQMRVVGGKDGARLRASELLPGYAERWRLKKHDGRAEAALLSLWGLTHLENGG